MNTQCKPLWVKCAGCAKFNAVAPATVVKYLDRVLAAAEEGASSPRERFRRPSSTGRELTPTEEDVRS